MSRLLKNKQLYITKKIPAATMVVCGGAVVVKVVAESMI